jgi:preprotein translocase subunit SecF
MWVVVTEVATLMMSSALLCFPRALLDSIALVFTMGQIVLTMSAFPARVLRCNFSEASPKMEQGMQSKWFAFHILVLYLLNLFKVRRAMAQEF